MRKYLTLLRIKISLAYFFPMSLGFAVAADRNPGLTWWHVPLAFLAFFCGSFFASTLNFYADIEADRNYSSKFKDMDLKAQPFVTGEMSKTETALAFALSAAGCVAFSLLAGLRVAFFIIGFMLVVGLLYSHPWFRLKARPLTDILCNVTGMAFTLMAGMSLGLGYWPPVLFLVWGSLFVTVMYIPTVVNDVPYDGAVGYRTSAVVFGARRMLLAMVPLTVAMVPLAVLVALNGSAPWQFRLAVIIGTPATIAGVIVIFHLWHPPSIDLNPNAVLIPNYLFIAFFVVYGIVRMVQGS